jgi:hypothetical protein
VHKTIDISRTKHEAASQLEGIFAQLVLMMTRHPRPFPSLSVFPAQNVEQIRRAQFRRSIGQPRFVNQQRKRDAGLFAKKACVMRLSEPDRRQVDRSVPERWFVFAQLRDVLAAKNSAVVSQKHEHGGPAGPQRPKLQFTSVRIR